MRDLRNTDFKGENLHSQKKVLFGKVPDSGMGHKQDPTGQAKKNLKEIVDEGRKINRINA